MIWYLFDSAPPRIQVDMRTDRAPRTYPSAGRVGYRLLGERHVGEG